MFQKFWIDLLKHVVLCIINIHLLVKFVSKNCFKLNQKKFKFRILTVFFMQLLCSFSCNTFKTSIHFYLKTINKQTK